MPTPSFEMSSNVFRRYKSYVNDIIHIPQNITTPPTQFTLVLRNDFWCGSCKTCHLFTVTASSPGSDADTRGMRDTFLRAAAVFAYAARPIIIKRRPAAMISCLLTSCSRRVCANADLLPPNNYLFIPPNAVLLLCTPAETCCCSRTIITSCLESRTAASPHLLPTLLL